MFENATAYYSTELDRHRISDMNPDSLEGCWFTGLLENITLGERLQQSALL